MRDEGLGDASCKSAPSAPAAARKGKDSRSTVGVGNFDLARGLEALLARGGGKARGLVHGRLRRRHDVGAVDQAPTRAVVAEDRELGHRRIESLRHELPPVDEAMPEACRALVAREREVGLETHLACVAAAGERERRGDLADDVTRFREADTFERDL